MQEEKSIYNKNEKVKREIPPILIKILFFSLGFILIIVLLILIRNSTDENKQDDPNPDRIIFPDIPTNYSQGTNFDLVNEIQINNIENNNYYILFPVSIDNIRRAAIRLNFLNEAEDQNFYIWSADEAPIQENVIKVLYNSGELSFNVPDGINESNISSEDAFEFTLDFFGLPKNENLEYEISSKKSSGIEFVEVRISYEGKPIYFNGISRSAGILTIENGKITEGYITIIPSITEINQRSLKPSDKINNNNINRLNYVLQVFPENPISSSPLGSETVITDYFDVRLNNYRESYYLFFNVNNDESYLVPSLEFNGNYQTNTNEFGEIILNVVDQL